MASPTTTASAANGRCPLLTALPTAAMEFAISWPWEAIQALCHISMSTAMPSTLALNISCPEPSKASAMLWAKMASIAAPSTAAITPPATHCPRPGTPRVIASTMPMIRPASITSRNTMMSAPSMWLFRDHDAFGGICMELADEFITAGRERSDANQAL